MPNPSCLRCTEVPRPTNQHHRFAGLTLFSCPCFNIHPVMHRGPHSILFSRAEIWEWKPTVPSRIPPGDVLVTIWLEQQTAIILLLSGIQGAEHSCWGEARHRHSLAKAACRSPWVLGAKQTPREGITPDRGHLPCSLCAPATAGQGIS